MLSSKGAGRGLGLSRNVEADLDITPFMNLMIVLVPVLLLSMVFTRITVIDLQLPAGASAESVDSLRQKQVEVVLDSAGLKVNFPAGVLLKKIPAGEIEQAPDYAALSLVLQSLKKHLQEKNADRRAINLLVAGEVPYHQIVSAMDAIRSYEAVVVTDKVEAELFPDIAFGDAPVSNKGSRS
jgi:biopolymer transport protein ExbD